MRERAFGFGDSLWASERGEGPPLVFLHGGLADHRAALLTVGSLATSTRVITPDVRCWGRSAYRGPLSWDRLADDVAALLDHLELDRALVGGVSAGSGAALRAAIKHPDRLVGLALVAPVFPGEEPDAELAAAVAPAVSAMAHMAEIGARAAEEGIEALLPIYGALPDAVRARAVEMARSFDPMSVRSATAFLASGAQPFRDQEELLRIEVETLILPGTDPQHPALVAERYASWMPKARRLEAEGEGIAAAIRSFQEELSGR